MLWREKAAFEALLRGFGGEAEVYRRGWTRDGDRDAEVRELRGRYRCLLSRWSGTGTAGEPAAENRSAARLYLPEEADIKAGDCVIVRQRGAAESFTAAGQPEKYPVDQAVAVRKEEIV